jgi:iron complex transport system substrate-binding protein
MQKNGKKPLIYVVTIVAIAAILVSTFSVIEINALQNTINQQSSELAHQNEILNQYNQTIAQQSSQLNQYNQTIAEQEQTIDAQNDELEQSKIVTVVDDFGYVVNITSTPTRIVSLAPSNTEILFAVGAGDQVVGITKYCDYPYNFTAWVAAGNMSSIGSYWQPAIEPIIALNPDLIIASGTASEEAATKLRNLDYNVIILSATTLNGVLNDMYLIGEATGHADEAASAVSSIRTRVDYIAQKATEATTSPKVYYETSNDPLMAAGPNTFVSDLISLAGGTNIFDDAATKWPTVSSDSIITKNPDVIVSYHTDFATRPGWSSINAVINDQIFSLPSSIFSRPGPRLVDALDSLSKILHPELFGAYS